MIRPHLCGRVLEVGAGIGGTTEHLCDGTQASWLCLEASRSLASRLRERVEARELPAICDVRAGELASLPGDPAFDVIIYADVLEHIADDAAEVRGAAQRLVPGGRLIVLAPAHDWLYSPFDRAIGHWRRYNRAGLCRLTPGTLRLVELRYLDSVGMLASGANRWLMRQQSPTRRQIRTWDRWMVPISRCLDPLLGYRLGKSIIGVWRKPDGR